MKHSDLLLLKQEAEEKGLRARIRDDRVWVCVLDQNSKFAWVLYTTKPINQESELLKMKKGIIIGSIHKTTGEFSISKKPTIHTNRREAMHEAARLARTAPEKKFILLNMDAIAETAEIVWS